MALWVVPPFRCRDHDAAACSRESLEKSRAVFLWHEVVEHVGESQAGKLLRDALSADVELLDLLFGEFSDEGLDPSFL